MYFNKESVDVNSLRRLGERHGRVINCHLAGDGEQAHAGYGYIEFASKGEAVAAQGALDGAKWDEFEVKKLQWWAATATTSAVSSVTTASTSTSPPPALPPADQLRERSANPSASNGERLSNVSNYNERTSATSFVSDDEDGSPYAAAPPPRPPPARRAPAAASPSARPPPVVWR